MEVKTNNISNRILKLSPTVELGLEKECIKEDFYSESEHALGKGGFASVWKVKHKISKKVYVVKVMSKQSIVDQGIEEQINREVEIMYKIDHPYVVRIFNHFEDEDNIYLLLEYISKGQLYNLLRRYRRFDERTVSQYILEVVSALEYIHSMNPPVIHRDIKPENILVDYDGSMKLADFGWSNFMDDVRKTYCGTPEYLAPEMVNKKSHDTSVDIWNLGVLIYELLNGNPPFRGKNQKELFSKIDKNKIEWPSDMDPLAKDLVKKILKKEASKRLSLKEIKKHAFFVKYPPAKELKPVVVLETKDKLELLTINKEPKANIEKSERTKEILKKIREESIDSVALNNLIEAQKQDRESVIKLDSEATKLRQELSTVTAELNKTQETVVTLSKYKEKAAKLEDEIEKLNLLNKQRLEVISTLEERDLEIIDLKIENKENKHELEDKHKKMAAQETEISQNQAELAILKEKTILLEQELTAEKQEKEQITKEFSVKLTEMQNKFIEEQGAEKGAENILSLIEELVKSSKTNFEEKIGKCRMQVHSVEESIESYKKVYKAELLRIESELDESVADCRNETKNLLKKPREILVNKERLDWMNKQITELNKFKTKNITLERDNRQLNRDLDMHSEKNKDVQEMCNLYQNLNRDLKSKLSTQMQYNANLEAKLGDVKDFVFKNCPDKLEEFMHFYKIYKKS